jgi:hypothetical protein
MESVVVPSSITKVRLTVTDWPTLGLSGVEKEDVTEAM